MNMKLFSSTQIASVFMISGGISTSVIFSSIYTDMGDGFRMLSIFWIVVGAIFLFVSLFGIFAAFKESTVLANLVRQNYYLSDSSSIDMTLLCA